MTTPPPAESLVASTLLDAARAWIAEDPDPATRAELTGLVKLAAADPDAAADLGARFAGRLEFGTAGLRGELGAGPRRMNRMVVAQAAAGLAEFLQGNPVAGQSGVVVGYDARHGSAVFACDTAQIIRGAGLRTLLLPRALPTPVLAFAIRHLGCAAGVMVTASHNPSRDNGYKVYLGDGSQIVPPADTEIAGCIARVGPVPELPRSEEYATLDDSVERAYVEAVAALPDPAAPRELSVVHTALHGVGASVVRQVLARSGYGPAHEVAGQADPDPDFPTVAFPNPEEPGAMDLALRTAREVGADIVVANDPDADRCAVAVPASDGWRMLRGDEVGVLLADFLLRSGLEGTYATTIVSSSLLGKLAAAAGQPYVETLTGFKWLGRVDGLVFGYEEALGYAVAPEIARDKDGISAIMRLLELAAGRRADGSTLLDRLDDLARLHGLHATDQLSVRVSDPSQLAAAMSHLREAPPARLGDQAVERLDDLATGSVDLPPTDALRFVLAGAGRVVIRPSGTEPKLKCYLEVVVPVDGDVVAARIAAAGRLDVIRRDIAEVVVRPMS
ncbi:MAG: phospho-sugar mutase [Nocardioidaceae bacterium]